MRRAGRVVWYIPTGGQIQLGLQGSATLPFGTDTRQVTMQVTRSRIHLSLFRWPRPRRVPYLMFMIPNPINDCPNPEIINRKRRAWAVPVGLPKARHG